MAETMVEPDWRPMGTAPDDGSYLLVKLVSGHVVIARQFPDCWMAEMSALWCDAVLDDKPMPDWTEENRAGWVPAPEIECEDLNIHEGHDFDDDIPF